MQKKTSTQVLVQAADLRDAVKKLDEGMKGTMADYQIASVAETAIMDVYPYSAEESITDTISENANSLLYAISFNHYLKVVRQQ